MRLLSFVSLAAALALTTATPLSSRAMSVHEILHALPKGFAHAGSVAPTEKITLRIALAHTDIAGLEKMTYDVSDPTSSLYRQHLTAEQVAGYVKPTDATLSAVTAWLSSHGITPTSASPAGDILQITVSVSTANTLLAAQFAQFTHVASGKKSIRTLQYSVPAALKDSIQFVHPTVAFVPPLGGVPGVTAINHPRSQVRKLPAADVEDLGPDNVVKKPRAADAVPASCANVVNPACLQAMYNIPTAPANHSAQNTLGVSGFISEFANNADLQLFLNTLNPTLAGTSFNLVEVDGGLNDQTPSEAGVEADLDIEYTVGVAGGVPVTFISVGDETNDDAAGFIDIANEILKLPVASRPTVLTTSYGFNEPDVPLSLAIGMCNAYMQLGAVGISVLFASGDGGVGGVQPTSCTTFVPSAPGGCPFVTSVGGSTGLPPQTAASLSGGGFSNHFAAPPYQVGDTQAYIASIGSQYAGLYNTTGRGMPDVAAQAEDVEITWQGGFFLVGGTSCASPIFASMIALVNDRLIAAGRPVLGFLNPFLYSPAGRPAFNDVTSGNNPGCGTQGFSASKGWDPVTGLGTPDFEKLLAAVGL